MNPDVISIVKALSVHMRYVVKIMYVKRDCDHKEKATKVRGPFR